MSAYEFLDDAHGRSMVIATVTFSVALELITWQPACMAHTSMQTCDICRNKFLSKRSV